MKKVAVTRVDKNEFFSDEKELIMPSVWFDPLSSPDGQGADVMWMCDDRKSLAYK